MRLRIPRPTLVICGGLQPALHELLGGDDDGLRPRWLPHLAPLPSQPESLSNGSHPASWQSLLGGDLLRFRREGSLSNRCCRGTRGCLASHGDHRGKRRVGCDGMGDQGR